MYAVIETGGKQYRVEVGTEVEVELLDVEPGEDMKFERVLLVADGETAAIGHPVVANAEVAATVIGRDRGVKTISFKYRPKARRRVKKGHRQELTLLRISDIVLDGHSAAADVAHEEAARKRDRSKLEEAARRQAAADAELAAKLAADKPVKAAPQKPAAKASPATKASPAKAAKSTPAKATKPETTTGKKTAAKPAAKTTAPAAKAAKATKAAPAKVTPAKSAPAKPTSKPAAKPEAKTSPTAKAPAKRTTKKES